MARGARTSARDLTFTHARRTRRRIHDTPVPMASKQSFDISTGVDLQEVDNAVNQAIKESLTR